MAYAAAGMAASTLGLSNVASRASISPSCVGDSMTYRPIGCLPRARRMAGKVYAVATTTVTTTVTEETKQYDPFFHPLCLSGTSLNGTERLLGVHYRDISRGEGVGAGELLECCSSSIKLSGWHFHYGDDLPEAMALKVFIKTSDLDAEHLRERGCCVLPSWAEFDIGKAPVYWKTMNGLPPAAGGKLTLFYNPEASKLALNPEFGVAFNGGFNQPFMCGGEPRSMTRKDRGKADPPFYTIKICVPKHAVSLIFSFTNGVDWDGPYKLQFEVPKGWRNKPISFFNEGLAMELNEEGACERAIFPGSNIVATRCSMIGNLSIEGGDRCNLDIVVGCTDPSSHLYNPLADVDDGSCPLDPDESLV